VTAGDFDGDGDLDLAIANYSSFDVSILRNNGDATFAPAVNYYLGGVYAFFVTAGDLDSDGDLDLVTVGPETRPASMLRNNGDGTFAAPIAVGDGWGPYSVTASDLDGDGDLDLAIAMISSGTIAIFRNNGNGSFADAVEYPVGADGATPSSVTAFDLDGDGDMDLATVHGPVSILRNNGDGTFNAAVTHAVGSGANSVTAFDLDSDGDMDLATANYNGTVSILRNNGDGTFNAAVNHAVGNGPNSVTAGDLDGDGDMDLATANSYSNSISVLFNMRDVIAPEVLSEAFDTELAQQFVITFDEPIDPASVDLSDVTATRVGQTGGVNPSSVTWSPDNTVATFTFIGLADGDYRFTLAAGAVKDLSGNELASEVVHEGADAFVLAGDATRDRRVDFADLLIVAQNFGEIGRTFSQGNFDYSVGGLVLFADLLILAQNYNASLIRAEPKPSVFGSRAIGRRGLFEAEEAVIV
jgi:hypothetical protein